MLLTLRQTAGPRHRVAVIAEPGEAIPLPVGKYVVETAALVRKDDEGRTWTAKGRGADPTSSLLGRSDRGAEVIDVTDGAALDLPIGPPLSATPIATVTSRAGQRLVKLELKITDAYGLEWTVEPQLFTQRSEPLVRILSADAKIVHRGRFEYG